MSRSGISDDESKAPLSIGLPGEWPFRLAPAPERRSFAGWMWTLFAILLFPLSIALALALMFAYDAGLKKGIFSAGDAIASLELVALGVFVITIGLAAYAIQGIVRKGRRLRKIGAVELLQRTPRAPVLFLRSFSDDYLPNPTRPMLFLLGRGRYEEALAKALSKIGPAISIGRPGESEPELGTARLYVVDDDWQTAVTYLMERAAVVMFVIGTSEGLWWEIEQAIRLVPRERLLFFFPFVEVRPEQQPWQQRHMLWFTGGATIRRVFPAMEQERLRRYRLFSARVQHLFREPLPAELGSSQFLTFSRNGVPRLLRTRKPWFSSLDRFNFPQRLLEAVPAFDFLPTSKAEIAVGATLRPYIKAALEAELLHGCK